jgi:glutathione S-transferase
VTLALAHKGLAVETVLVDPEDRDRVVQVSGQPLVPVLVDGDTVVADSVAILRHLDVRVPAPPLLPGHPARRAEVLVFVDWFERVWKRPPNLIAEELAGPEPDHTRIAVLGAQMRAALDRFEDLLTDRDHLFGDELSLADCVAFPFLKYAALHDPDDDELFHRVLRDEQPLTDRHGRLRAWIARMDARPRA